MNHGDDDESAARADPGAQPGLDRLPGRALVDVEGRIVFYNDAAAEIVGSPFEEIGTMTREEWNARYGPFDEHGRPLPPTELPLTLAIREGRPAYARLRVRGERGLLEVEAGALPLLGPAGYHGAMVFFWVAGANADGTS